MPTKRAEAEARALAKARALVDNFDGLDNSLDSLGYLRWHEASIAFRDLDDLKLPKQRELPKLEPKSIRRQIVNNVLLMDKYVGLTSHELEERLRKPHETVSPAVNWLVGVGWLRDSGKQRRTLAGRYATVWSLTDAGFNRLRCERQDPTSTGAT